MRPDFFEGVRGGLPVAIAVAPFGALFGALAVDKGMSLAEATLMSATVYAGASQLVGIELFGHEVAAWIIVLSILAVNFRHVLYSAAIAPYIQSFTGAEKAAAFFLLVDPQFAEAAKRGESGERVTFPWYMGFGLGVYIPWIAFTIVGALLGGLITDQKAMGLDALLPAYFLGTLIDFRSRPNFLPVAMTSAVFSALAYHYVGSPWHVSLGALAGITLAAILPPPSAKPAGPEGA
ncbi:AzlC family ABC transporter permease [Oryzifoliimicrobium ureilyticus]|uniref:AzlC family ABC transporter permease n=1 Tax=Oryzifoliimicrobium ureilyticus TaxID=3113724 RepID=UPI00307600BD